MVIFLAATTVKVKEPKRSRALVRQETIASYLFLLPSLIFFLGFVIYPMILCVVTSFFDSTMNRADVFVGLANYKELFADKIFLGALKNTFIIVIVSVPVTCAFSLWVSSAIVDLPEWATSLFRCVFYLPVVTGSVAVTVVWKWMYNNYYGIFNYLGKTLGLIDKNINWLGDERFALGCIILILLTTSVGQPIVLYVSALGNVDQSIVEAAEVDGATDFQCFWKIKRPAIMPTTLYILVITTINSFQCFALIQLLTSGGPNHSTDTIMYYIYYTRSSCTATATATPWVLCLPSSLPSCLLSSSRLATRIIEEVRNNECNCCNRKKQKPLKRHPSKLKQASAYTILTLILISIVAVTFAFPLYWIITGSFKTGAAINSTTPSGGPMKWVLTNYQKLFAGKSAPLWQLAVPFSARFSADGDPIYFSVGPTAPAALRWMINTVFMAVVSMILTCITAAMAGYALAKKRFVGRQLLFTLIVSQWLCPSRSF